MPYPAGKRGLHGDDSLARDGGSPADAPATPPGLAVGVDDHLTKPGHARTPYWPPMRQPRGTAAPAAGQNEEEGEPSNGERNHERSQDAAMFHRQPWESTTTCARSHRTAKCQAALRRQGRGISPLPVLAANMVMRQFKAMRPNQPCVCRPDLRWHMARVRVRGLRDRCLLTADRRLVGVEFAAQRFGARCAGARASSPENPVRFTRNFARGLSRDVPIGRFASRDKFKRPS